MIALACLTLAAWAGLLLFRGGFWKADQLLPAAAPPDSYPPVAVVIPARNEADTIGDVVAAHLASGYPGALAIVVADDHSGDGTAEKARAQAGDNLHIASVPDLPSGWSGKLWALKAGIAKANDVLPEAEFLLLSDADILVGDTLLKKLVAQAERQKLDLTSVMARLDDKGFWGGLLVPAFIFFFQKLYPFPMVNDHRCPVAGAAGGVVLLRREALTKIGGIDALRGALIDDCTLARLVKRTEPEGRIGLYLASSFAEARSLRDNSGYGAMEAMVARSAYTQLDHNPLALIGTLIGLAFLYLVPPLLVLGLPFHGSGGAALLGLLSWGLMAWAYRPTLKRYDRRRREAFLLPLAALFYGWFTWLSAWRHWRGKGGAWKGRHYPARSPS